MDQAVVEGEHEWRVYGVRRNDRGSVRRAAFLCLLFGHGGTVWHRPVRKKGHREQGH
jgi:hypothetical protein